MLGTSLRPSAPLRRLALGVLFACGLIGCPPPATNMDAGAGDTGGALPMLPPATTGTPSNPTAAPADYACLGTAASPTPGAPIDYTFQLRGFGSGDAVRMARVWFFPDNVLLDTCTGSCVDVMTDGSGNLMINSPTNGWYAYRVFPLRGGSMSSTYVDSVQINEPAPSSAGASVEGNAVSVSTLNLIPAAYGFMRVPRTAIVAGQVQDCTSAPIRGAIVRLFNPDGSEIFHVAEDVTAPHIQYFDGMDNPDNSTEYTQVDGLYAAANLPAPATGIAQIRAEAWGVSAAGMPVARISCEVVGVYADGVSIVNLGPLRNDYPAGHLCAGL